MLTTQRLSPPPPPPVLTITPSLPASLPSRSSFFPFPFPPSPFPICPFLFCSLPCFSSFLSHFLPFLSFPSLHFLPSTEMVMLYGMGEGCMNGKQRQVLSSFLPSVRPSLLPTFLLGPSCLLFRPVIVFSFFLPFSFLPSDLPTYLPTFSSISSFSSPPSFFPAFLLS